MNGIYIKSKTNSNEDVFVNADAIKIIEKTSWGSYIKFIDGSFFESSIDFYKLINLIGIGESYES